MSFAGRRFNHTAPCAVKRAGIADEIRLVVDHPAIQAAIRDFGSPSAPTPFLRSSDSLLAHEQRGRSASAGDLFRLVANDCRNPRFEIFGRFDSLAVHGFSLKLYSKTQLLSSAFPATTEAG